MPSLAKSVRPVLNQGTLRTGEPQLSQLFPILAARRNRGTSLSDPLGSVLMVMTMRIWMRMRMRMVMVMMMMMMLRDCRTYNLTIEHSTLEQVLSGTQIYVVEKPNNTVRSPKLSRKRTTHIENMHLRQNTHTCIYAHMYKYILCTLIICKHKITLAQPGAGTVMVKEQNTPATMRSDLVFDMSLGAALKPVDERLHHSPSLSIPIFLSNLTSI